MSNYKIGSSGTGVEELQRKLNEKGNYALEVDGQYGAKTEQAVKDFQKSNGLTVDGIVGNETKGALGISSTAATPTTNSIQKSTAPTSNAVSPAKQQLSMLQKGYSSPLDDAINGLFDSVFNQSKATFDYDVSGDPAHNQYAETYKRNAKLMSEDALAQASALTGGYGSSYGQAVASQAYNEQLSKMNDIVPELRQNAYNEWNDERAKEIEALTLLLNERDRERSIYESDRQYEQEEQDRLDRREELALSAGFSSWDEFKESGGNSKSDNFNDNMVDFDKDFLDGAINAYKSKGINGLDTYFDIYGSKYSDDQLSWLGESIEQGYDTNDRFRGVPSMNNIDAVERYLRETAGGDALSLADREFLDSLVTYDGTDKNDTPDTYRRYLDWELYKYLQNRKYN